MEALPCPENLAAVERLHGYVAMAAEPEQQDAGRFFPGRRVLSEQEIAENNTCARAIKERLSNLVRATGETDEKVLETLVSAGLIQITLRPPTPEDLLHVDGLLYGGRNGQVCVVGTYGVRGATAMLVGPRTDGNCL